MPKTFPATLAAILMLIAPGVARAHCDTLNGPVVTDARTALAQGDVTPVLKWVKTDREVEIRAAFAETLVVRRHSKAAADLADRYFFETLVRVHRAGEGTPYAGLKAAEAIDPGIEAADHALASGQADRLVETLAHRLAAGIKERFHRALEAKQHAHESVEAGRAYVAAYVEFIHYYERLFAEAGGGPAPADGHHH
ncbi:MAG: hypothetical protein A3G75_06870 [Verrucomicrobia bacterium RIFCSPLOWO2_12_FULL_64_8]|nr:MAG: hypothetical protein A3G75_06870 [Verrucomicrobia bacterium RIFCSPLOWO2_12_FULL_64_8]